MAARGKKEAVSADCAARACGAAQLRHDLGGAAAGDFDFASVAAQNEVQSALSVAAHALHGGRADGLVAADADELTGRPFGQQAFEGVADEALAVFDGVFDEVEEDKG